jgi:hypothetical protein
LCFSVTLFMKLLTTPLLLLFAIHTSSCLADFFIFQTTPIKALYSLAANQYNCNALVHDDSGAVTGSTTFNGNFATATSFTMGTGMCGAGKLDYKKEKNSSKWDIYEHGTNTYVGFCKPSTGKLNCLDSSNTYQFEYDVELYCWSFICK